MMSIKEILFFKANPKEIYELLMNSKKHSELTGSKAVIGRKVGSKFSAYDNYISGINVKLVKNKKIVQKWRGNDWPKGHYSTVTFELKEKKDGTELTFTQIGIPTKDCMKVDKKGWNDFYWVPMRKIIQDK